MREYHNCEEDDCPGILRDVFQLCEFCSESLFLKNELLHSQYSLQSVANELYLEHRAKCIGPWKITTLEQPRIS